MRVALDQLKIKEKDDIKVERERIDEMRNKVIKEDKEVDNDYIDENKDEKEDKEMKDDLPKVTQDADEIVEEVSSSDSDDE